MKKIACWNIGGCGCWGTSVGGAVWKEKVKTN